MSAHQGNRLRLSVQGNGRGGSAGALGLLVGVIAAAVLALPSAAAGASTDLATSYQLDPAHDGYETAPITAPLTKLWSVPLPALTYSAIVASQPLIVNGVVYYTVNGTLYAVRQSTGAPLWSKSMGTVNDLLNIAYDAGQIFALNDGGVLVAVDAATGATNWAITVPGGQYLFQYDPVATNGRVYLVGSGNAGTIYAVNEANGQVYWDDQVENGDGAPAVDSTGVYTTETCDSDEAFNLLTGRVLWADSSGCTGGGGATAVLGGGYVFARDIAGADTILSESDGATDGVFAGSVAPAVGAGSAYILDQGTLSAVSNDGLGTNTWTFGGSTSLTMAPLRVGNLVFDASTSGTLYAIDAATGATPWSGNLGSTITNGVGQYDVGGISAGQNTVVVPTDSAVVAYAGANAGSGTPTNTTAPAVAGSPAVGVPVGVDAGVWTGLPGGYSYQWMRCPSGSPCTDIAGATGEGYVPVAADLGDSLEVSVTATNSTGTSSVVLTPPSAAVIPGPPANVSPPTITGSPVVGGTVTAATGNWTNNPTTYDYQWLACITTTVCQPISGATSSTLVVPTSAYGETLEVTVTAVNGAGGSVPATSLPTMAVIEPTTLTLASSSNPATAASEVTFTATISPKPSGGTVTFTADGQPIPGCTSMPVSQTYAAFLCEVYGITAGTWQIAASYSGDSAYGPSSAGLTETVKAATTPPPILPPSRSVGHRGATKSHRPDFGLVFLAVRSVATPHVYAFAAEHVVCHHASSVRVTIGASTVTLSCGTKLAFASKHLAVHQNYRIRLQAIRYGAKRRIVAGGRVYTLTLYMPGDEATWTPLPGLTANARIQEVRFGAGARGREVQR